MKIFFYLFPQYDNICITTTVFQSIVHYYHCIIIEAIVGVTLLTVVQLPHPSWL